MGQKDKDEHGLALLGPIHGVHTRNIASKLKDGAYADLRGLEFTEDVGGFSIGKGSKRFNTTVLSGATPIRGLKRTYHGTTKRTLVAHGTSIYDLAVTPGAALVTGLTSDKDTYFESYGLYDFSVNGYDAPRRFEGSTVRTMGFPASAIGAMSATPGVAGVLTGQVQYAVSNVFDSTAANESSVTLGPSTTPTAQKVDLASIPVGPTGTTSRNLYRKKSGGTQFYFLASIADNVTTVYTDNIADTALDTARQAPRDNGVPPSDLMLLLIRKGRAYGVRRSEPDKLYMSAIVSTERSATGGASIHGAGIEIWPANHWVRVSDKTSDIRALDWWRDHVVALTSDDVHMIRGETPSNFQNIPMGAGIGCAATRSVVNMGTQHGIFFLSVSEGAPGVYRFFGGAPQCVSDDIEKRLKANVKLGSSFTVQPCAGRQQGLYVLTYPKDATPTYETAVFDTKGGKRWEFIPTRAASCYASYEGQDDAGELVFGDASAGWVIQWGTGGGEFDIVTPTTPNNAVAYIETDWLALDAPGQVKQFWWIEITGTPEPTALLTVERRMNLAGSGTTTGCNAVAMAANLGSAFHKRIDCEMEGGTTPEQGLLLKLCITISVPYATEGAAFLPVRISDIVIRHDEAPPTSHDRNFNTEDVSA